MISKNVQLMRKYICSYLASIQHKEKDTLSEIFIFVSIVDNKQLIYNSADTIHEADKITEELIDTLVLLNHRILSSLFPTASSLGAFSSS